MIIISRVFFLNANISNCSLFEIAMDVEMVMGSVAQLGVKRNDWSRPYHAIHTLY